MASGVPDRAAGAERAGGQRGLAHLGEAPPVAGARLGVRQRPVRGEDRLGLLQVGVAGQHDAGIEQRGRLRGERVGEARHLDRERARRVGDPQPQVGRHLVVAALAAVDRGPGRRPGGQLGLTSVCTSSASRPAASSADRSRPIASSAAARRATVRRREQAGAAQRPRPRRVEAQVVGEESRVERQRTLEGEETRDRGARRSGPSTRGRRQGRRDASSESSRG
jgi:hypothetical protein